MTRLFAVLATFVFTAVPALARQQAPPAPAPSAPGAEADQELAGQVLRVFFDCSFLCDFNNIRQDVTFINYVRDQGDADVHVLVTTRSTASGGREYTFDYIGQGRFADIRQQLVYTSNGSDTEDERRQGVSRTFSLGLTPFLLRTPSADQFSLAYASPRADQPPAAAQARHDPWNFWIFRVGASTELDGEERQKGRRIRVNLSANRTTERWKFTISTNGDFNDDEFTLSDGRKLDSSRDTWDVAGTVIKSVGPDHWGAIVRAQTRSSTQTNERHDTRVSAGLEYDVFPYAESTRRSMVIQYSLGASFVEYFERTLFDKLEETLVDHRLAAILALRQPWGTTRMSAVYSAFLHDPSKYNIDLFADANVRLFRGLGLNVQGSYSRVRNQLYLAAGGATDEEILLRLRRLATGYRYRMQVGFSYQFGSIYNNVVNPRWSSTPGRFGGAGGG